MTDELEVPDVYCDQFNMAQSPYGIAFTFSLSPNIPGSAPGPGQPQATTQAVVRMSLELAKVMTILIRKNIKQYELEHLGDPIRVPHSLLQQMKLEETDW